MKTISTLLTLNCILFSSCVTASEDGFISDSEMSFEEHSNNRVYSSKVHSSNRATPSALNSDNEMNFPTTPHVNLVEDDFLLPPLTVRKKTENRKPSLSLPSGLKISTNLGEEPKAVSSACSNKNFNWDEYALDSDLRGGKKVPFSACSNKKFNWDEAAQDSDQQVIIEETMPNGVRRKYTVTGTCKPFLTAMSRQTSPLTSDAQGSPLMQSPPFSKEEKKDLEKEKFTLPSSNDTAVASRKVTAEEYKAEYKASFNSFRGEVDILKEEKRNNSYRGQGEETRTGSSRKIRGRTISSALSSSADLLADYHDDQCMWSNTAAIPPSQREAQVATGDLVGFAGKGCVSGMVRCCLQGKRENVLGVSHVGVILVASIEEIKSIVDHCSLLGALNSSRKKTRITKYLNECLEQRAGNYNHNMTKMRPFLIHSTGKYGVHIAPLRDYVLSYEGSIYLRHLKTPIELKNLLVAIKRDLGKEYNPNPIQMTRAVKGGNSKQLDRSMFCSQLVADLYTSVGILNEEDVMATNITPAQFTSTNRSDVLKDLAEEEITLKFSR